MSQLLFHVANILEKFKFDFSKLPDRLKCVLCHDILKNAKQTSCGCKVCEKCIISYLSNGPKSCPSNQPECMNVKLDNNDINQDNATNKEIGNLLVKCPFNACPYSCALRNMVEHLDSCEHREIVCEKCGNKFGAKERVKHDKDKCEMRIVSCHSCGVTMTSKDLSSIHLNPDRDELCSKFVSFCPNNCNETRKINLKDHLKVCPNKKIECPFHQFECKLDKMTKEKLMKHMEEEYLNHPSSLINKIKDLEAKVVSLESELNNQIQITKELFDMNKKSSESCLKIEKTIEDLKKKGPTSSIQTIENKNVIFRNGSFIWKFSDFEVKRVDAESGGRVSVTSDTFYTSDFGYKMCLRVYPAGDGVGKGTHLSVFFAIMKGEFDDVLSWPFKQKVTLSILDQETDSKHHSDTFIPDARSACYQKPTDECNIASGSPKFILRSLIMNNSIYCTNDTIYLKFTVDTMKIKKTKPFRDCCCCFNSDRDH